MAAGEQGAYYSVVVPVYNEAGNLPELHTRLTAVMRALARPYEIIFVDDGSTDQSVPIMRSLQDGDPHLVIICFQRNFGQHPAVIAGFNRAAGEVIITLDADLQNPPEEIPKLLAKLDEGYELVSGWRRRRKDPLARTLPSLVVNKMMGALTGISLKDYGCMLRAYRRQVVEYLKLFPERAKFITALTSWLRVKICEVEVEQSTRRTGTSKYNYPKLIRMNFDLLTGFSITPIQVVSAIGLGIALLGFLLGTAILVWNIAHGRAAFDVATLAAIVLMVSGIQLLALGMIGEYVGRTFVQVQGRPYYIVKAVFEPSRAGGQE